MEKIQRTAFIIDFSKQIHNFLFRFFENVEKISQMIIFI